MAPGFNLPSNLLYNEPQQTLSGSDINWVSFKPTDRGEFSQNQNLRIRVSSNSQFLVAQRSYLKYDLTLTGPSLVASTSASYLTQLGGVSVLKNVRTSCGGVQLEDLPDYATYCGNIYKRSPVTYQNMLKTLELYKDDAQSLNKTTNHINNGYTICHSLRNCLESMDQAVPLPFIRSGIELSFDLESVATIATSNLVTGYKISNVEFIACLLTPDAKYMETFASNLSSNGIASIPIKVVRSLQSNPAASTIQEKTLQLGFYKSVNNVSIIQRLESVISDTAQDSFFNDISGIEEFYFRTGNTRYPLNTVVRCNNDVTKGVVSAAEQNMIALCSLDNTYAGLNSSSGIATDPYCFFSFQKSPSFGSGIACEDGVIVWNTKFNAVPVTTIRQNIFFNVDSKLMISGDAVMVDYKNF